MSTKTIRIMGIDPGSRVTGFGCIELAVGAGGHLRPDAPMRHLTHGVILLPENDGLPARLKVLTQSLGELFAKYKPHYVAVEKIFLGRNADSAFKLGHARGVVLAQAAMLEVDGADVMIAEYATRLVKKAVGGKGSADKAQVQRMVQHYLRLGPSDLKRTQFDASDALALAIYHAQVLHGESRLKQHRRTTRELE